MPYNNRKVMPFLGVQIIERSDNMSETVKFTMSDENYVELCLKAKDKNMSIQEYIRSILFPNQITEITPENAVRKALEKYSQGDTFTVPEIWGTSWDLKNGYAGVFGRRFNKLIRTEYSERIVFTGEFNIKNHAIYEIL